MEPNSTYVSVYRYRLCSRSEGLLEEENEGIDTQRENFRKKKILENEFNISEETLMSKKNLNRMNKYGYFDNE